MKEVKKFFVKKEKMSNCKNNVINIKNSNLYNNGNIKKGKLYCDAAKIEKNSIDSESEKQNNDSKIYINNNEDNKNEMLIYTPEETSYNFKYKTDKNGDIIPICWQNYEVLMQKDSLEAKGRSVMKLSKEKFEKLNKEGYQRFTYGMLEKVKVKNAFK